MKDWVTLIYFKLTGTSWKTYLDDFVDESNSRHDNQRIKLRWGVDDIKFERSLCRDLCENYIAHCLFVWIFFGLEVVHVSHITACFGPIPKVLFLDTEVFLQVGSRHCRIKDSNNNSHSFVKTALLASDTSLNLSTT